ncbi:MAG: DNA repair protein RadC [Deltaproteobacteria bacterium]|nr:DNA repair protein RadC [Deltaproteobacteria bacterium]
MTEDQIREIREMPLQERPRERLLSHGSETLSDAELLAVLLRTGSPGLPVMTLARELLEEWRGLGGMPGLSYRDLRRRGLGAAKAASLLAAVEIGRRLALGKLQSGDVLSRPSSVAAYLMLRYGRKHQEVMGALFLDSRHRLIASQEFFRGTLQRTSVEPRAILKEALLRGSAAIVLFHTHPSGDPSPSNEDILFTRRMVEAGDWVGVRVIDHFILGSAGSFVSLQQRGECMPPAKRDNLS